MCQPRRAPPWRGWWGAARQRAAPNAFLGVKRPMLPHRQRPLPQRATRARATPLTHERVARASGMAECAAAAAGKAPSPAPTPKTQAGGLRASQAPHGAQPQPRRARARVGWRAGVGGAGALGPPRSALRVALSMECRMSAVAFTLRSLRSVDQMSATCHPACMCHRCRGAFVAAAPRPLRHAV